MKRKAILLGAPLTESSTLNISTGIDAWCKFFGSAIGGGWKSEEILKVNAPTLDCVRSALKNTVQYDFIAILFLGSGYIQKDMMGVSEIILNLNPNEEISERELNPGCPRCMLIADCCFAFDDAIKSIDSEMIDKMNSISSLDLSCYEKKILECEKGYIRIYANYEEPVSNKKKSFTRILFENIIPTRFESNDSIRTDQAVDMAADVIREQHLNMNLQYRGGRRLRHYPLIINLDSDINK